MSYDRNTGQYSSTSDSITVSVPGFGDTYSVERLSGGLITFPYFDGFVDYFVKRGYERGRSIRAAPYDWRLGPGGLPQYYINFTPQFRNTLYSIPLPHFKCHGLMMKCDPE